MPPENMATSASGSEKGATPSAMAPTSAPASAPGAASKLRSCVVCRSRKVRCDKQSPCSNCRRANIPCVSPPTHRPPRWARRLDRLTYNGTALYAAPQQDGDPGIDKVMDRLRTLEGLVKELSGELEHARAAATSFSNGTSVMSSPAAAQERDAGQQRDTALTAGVTDRHAQHGRLVSHNHSHARYVSSGFWSKISDELEGLKVDARDLTGGESESSDDETSFSSRQSERTPSEHNAFLFRTNLNMLKNDLHAFRPLPSQIPFLLETFAENVNIMRLVHMPSVRKLARDMRSSNSPPLTASNEALMFSIYYAAIISMEDDDVIINFGSDKSELSSKYRVGLEQSLAKADFLNAPDMVLIQAFIVFLCLVRRYDSPKWTWMMTGLVIRMAQYLGLQRDGMHFAHLSPFEVEMRRRVWWNVCTLDLRASEDQGTEPTIIDTSFDTKFPLNLNETDINPDMKEMPQEHEGVTDMTFPRINYTICQISKKVLAASARGNALNLEQQSRLVDEIYKTYEIGYFKFQHATDKSNTVYWVSVTIARLVMAKMTLVGFLPVLFSSPSDIFTDEIRTKLLISAIEVAEYNHALNSEKACRHMRWIFQTYTHWYAIVYLLIEISRRPWSQIVERAWIALHSSWLVPARTMNNDLRVWVPLRKLMAKARKHREAEINRLRSDPQAASALEVEEHEVPVPSSPAPPTSDAGDKSSRGHWLQLVGLESEAGDGMQLHDHGSEVLSVPSNPLLHTIRSTRGIEDPLNASVQGNSTPFTTPDLPANGMWGLNSLERTDVTNFVSGVTTRSQDDPYTGQPSALPGTAEPMDSSNGHNMGPGLSSWLWADADPSADVFSGFNYNNMDMSKDFDGETNWYQWVESAGGLGMGTMLHP